MKRINSEILLENFVGVLFPTLLILLFASFAFPEKQHGLSPATVTEVKQPQIPQPLDNPSQVSLPEDASPTTPSKPTNKKNKIDNPSRISFVPQSEIDELYNQNKQNIDNRRKAKEKRIADALAEKKRKAEIARKKREAEAKRKADIAKKIADKKAAKIFAAKQKLEAEIKAVAQKKADAQAAAKKKAEAKAAAKKKAEAEAAAKKKVEAEAAAKKKVEAEAAAKKKAEAEAAAKKKAEAEAAAKKKAEAEAAAKKKAEAEAAAKKKVAADKKRKEEAARKKAIQKRLTDSIGSTISDLDAKEAAAAAAAAKDLAITQGEKAIKFKINRKWTAPANLPQGLSVKLSIKLSPQGKVLGSPQLLKSSGYPAFDNSTIEAIKRASPLPLPKKKEWANEFTKEDLIINFP